MAHLPLRAAPPTTATTRGYPSIAEHGIIGDLHTAALVAAAGTIDWYCPERFDGPSVSATSGRSGSGIGRSACPRASCRRRRRRPGESGRGTGCRGCIRATMQVRWTCPKRQSRFRLVAAAATRPALPLRTPADLKVKCGRPPDGPARRLSLGERGSVVRCANKAGERVLPGGCTSRARPRHRRRQRRPSLRTYRASACRVRLLPLVLHHRFSSAAGAFWSRPIC